MGLGGFVLRSPILYLKGMSHEDIDVPTFWLLLYYNHLGTVREC